MKKWADMTERERDVLVAKTLGAQIYEVIEGRSFKSAVANENPRQIVSRTPLLASKSYWGERGLGFKSSYGSNFFNTETGEEVKCAFRYTIPHYSTDHASAMTLLDGGWLKMWRADRTEQPHFSMTIKTKEDEIFISGMRDTFPEAICVCFLRAKGVEIE